MDPATPDWRAFGQPAEVKEEAAARPDARSTLLDRLGRLPRSTLIGIAAAVVIASTGLALAALTPGGGDIAIVDGGGSGALDPAAGAATGGATGSPIEMTGIAGGPMELVVDVAGAVAQPGLVRLPRGSRVGDAITAAGGYAVTADLVAAGTTINLAAPVGDGDKVLVPGLEAGAANRGGGAAGGDRSGDGAAGAGLVDLNRADQAALEALPGIGPVTASRILEARGEAPFRSVEELRSRGLVGAATFTKLRDLVTTGR